MNIIVFGANGMVGQAICRELARQGHFVTPVNRATFDFATPRTPDEMNRRVRGADIVINAVGILLETPGNTYQRVHVDALAELCAACERERVARIVQICALGVDLSPTSPYLSSKLEARRVLASHGVDYVVVRPGLILDAVSPSTQLFVALARTPIVVVPSTRRSGEGQISAISLGDVASCVARIAAHPKALRRVIELSGPSPTSYKNLLQCLRTAQGKGRAIWLPIPWWLMRLTASIAQLLPQRVVSVDNVRLLEAGSTSTCSETARWLGRAPIDPLMTLANPGSPRTSLTTDRPLHAK